MSVGARKRVQTAAEHLDGGRCIIERVHEDSAVQYTHVLARATPDETIECLEFSWGIKYGTLNLDTRENIFKLSATLRVLFDRGEWMLLPKEDIIQQYFDAVRFDLPKESVAPETRRATFPTIKAGKYQYNLLAYLPMCRVPIHRQTSSLTNTSQVSASDFTFLDFPFRGFEVTSHIHPRFVICNAGQKIMKSGDIELKQRYPQEAHLIEKIRIIYTSWTKYVENTEAFSNFRDSEDSGGPGDMRSQTSSRQTKKRRANTRKRPALNEWDSSPTRQGGQKQGQGNQDAAWKPDGATLCELEIKKDSEYVGRGGWPKGVSIMEWADRVAELTKVDGGASRMENSAGAT